MDDDTPSGCRISIIRREESITVRVDEWLDGCFSLIAEWWIFEPDLDEDDVGVMVHELALTWLAHGAAGIIRFQGQYSWATMD